MPYDKEKNLDFHAEKLYHLLSGKTVTDFQSVPSRRLAIALEKQICKARSFLFMGIAHHNELYR
jgi:hypothetical protein